jgi:hypothetical protein
MMWLLPPTLLSLSLFSLPLSLPVCDAGRAYDGRGEGAGEEPNHTTARKPGPLCINRLILSGRNVLVHVILVKVTDSEKCS